MCLLVRRIRQARDGHGRRFLSGFGFFAAEHEHADDDYDHGDDADADEQGKKGLLWKCLGTAAEHKAVDGEQED